MKKLIKGSVLTSLVVMGSLTSCGASCVHTGGEATCTSLAVCSLCGEEYGELDLNNHTFVAGDVTTQPTCTVAGVQVYNCECGESKTEPVAATGHNHSLEYTIEEETHYYACSCGDKKDEEAHEYSIAGEVTKAPTCINGGTQLYSCVCGDSIENSLPSLGGHIDENEDVYCDREGCNSKVARPNRSEVSIAWAIAAVNSEINISSYRYYVTGTVKEVHNNNNGFITITDGTNDLYINTIVGANDEAYVEFDQKAVVGDVVKLYGEIKKDESKNVPSMYNVTMTIVEHTHDYKNATCKLPATCACGLTSGAALGHESNDSDTLCDRCGFDTSLTVARLAVMNSEGMDESLSTRIQWTNDILYFSITLNGGGTLYKVGYDYARINKNNNFTVFVDIRYRIYQVTYHLLEGTSASTVNSFANIFKSAGHTVIIDGTDVTIDIAGTDSVKFNNNTGKDICINGVTVAYK